MDSWGRDRYIAPTAAPPINPGARASQVPLPRNGLQKFIVQPEWDGQRLDRALALGSSGLSRGEARRLIAAGVVFVSGRRSGICSRLVRAGESIAWQSPARFVDESSGTDGGLHVVIERPGFWILDKPAGMPVEATRSGKVGTVVDVLHRRSGRTPFVTHRLDAATSGLLVVARQESIQAELNGLFAAHAISRRYLAVVALNTTTDGAQDTLWASGRVTIDRPLDGKAAVTHVTRVARSAYAAALVIDLETGRTRQIRRHLAAMGCPVVGESTTGQRTVGRLMLHAYQLSLPSTFSGGAIEAKAPLPEDFLARTRALEIDLEEQHLEAPRHPG
jgi:23S rRNA pseudouridine1911/1915/1917 synthase